MHLPLMVAFTLKGQKIPEEKIYLILLLKAEKPAGFLKNRNFWVTRPF